MKKTSAQLNPAAVEGAMGVERKPDPKAFVKNLKGDLAFHKKLYLFLKNNARKMITAKTCCGHPGEPGC